MPFDDAPEIARRIALPACSCTLRCASLVTATAALRRYLHRPGKQRRHVVRQADHAQAIGAVRRELQLDTGVGQAKILGQRLADRRVVRQLQQAGRIGIDAQLLGRTQHADRLHATQLRRLDAMPPGRLAPTVASGTLRPARAFGAPQTICSGAPVPASTLAHLQAVGFRVLLGADDLRDHDARPDLRRARDAFHFQPGHRQRTRQRRAVSIDPDQLAQPVFGEFHEGEPAMSNGK